MSEKRYSWKDYRNSANYKEDMERILNSGSRIDSFDRNTEAQSRISLRQLLTPFDI